MFLRFLLLSLVFTVLIRALWRLVAGVIDGVSRTDSRQHPSAPDRGVRMVRDPVCGTFLPPGNAVSLTDRGGVVRYFCSERCRDAFRARE